MIRFTEFVARLKAWQVFILLVFPMIGGQFYLMSLMPSPGTSTQPPNMEDFNALFAHTMQIPRLRHCSIVGMPNAGRLPNR